MNKYNKVIGLGCIAYAGKDSAFNILQKYLPVKRVAFADALKKAIKPLLWDYLGVDSFTNNKEQKNLIRPILIEFGNAARKQNHRTWIEKVNKEIDFILSEGNIAVVTDVRFDLETGDEADFIQDELKGVLVNVDRILDDGSFLKPNNPSEELNYPKIKHRADVCIAAGNLEDLEKELVTKVLPLL